MSKELEQEMRAVEFKKLFGPKAKGMSLRELGALSLRLMEHSASCGDLRFLNTALKVNDRLRGESRDKALLLSIDAAEKAALAGARKTAGVGR